MPPAPLAQNTDHATDHAPSEDLLVFEPKPSKLLPEPRSKLPALVVAVPCLPPEPCLLLLPPVPASPRPRPEFAMPCASPVPPRPELLPPAVPRLPLFLPLLLS